MNRFNHFLVLLILGFSVLGWACSCADVTPRSCNLLANNREVVFLGTVTSVENPPDEHSPGGGVATYHFRVEEQLSGAYEPEAVVVSGRGGADCSVWFRQGVSYLVFAYRSDDGELRSNACSKTQPAEGAGALLAQLRAMREGKQVATIYGTLMRRQEPYASTDQPDFDQSLGKTAIKFQSSKRTYSATTDADGSYALYDVPPGTYKVSADLPDDLEIAQTILLQPVPPLELPLGACLEYDIDALPKGKIRGNVIGPDGKPVGNVSVELFLVERYKENKRGWWEFQKPENGYFEFLHVAPGDYYLVYNNDNSIDTDGPFPRTFYPDAPDLARATPIHLAPGQQLLHADIHVRGGQPTRKLTVRVTLEHGGWLKSSVISVKGTKGEGVFASEVDRNVYEMNLLLDSQYTITAQALSCKPDSRSKPLVVDGADKWVSDVTILLPDTECDK